MNKNWFEKLKKGIFFKGFWIVVFIHVIVIYVPHYYRITAKIPPKEELMRSTGDLVLKETGRRGRLIGLQSEGSITYFTCRYNLGGYHDLCKDKSLGGVKFTPYMLPSFVGKKTTIYWYKQPMYPFYYQKRIVIISIEGTKYISYDEAQRNIKEHADSMFIICFSFVMLLFVFSLGMYANKDA